MTGRCGVAWPYEVELLSKTIEFSLELGWDALVAAKPGRQLLFLSHDDRSRINGELSWGVDFGWKGPILVDGGITAAWRVRRNGKPAVMTIELGRRLTPAERRDLEEEATRLATFLDPDRTRELVIVEPG